MNRATFSILVLLVLISRIGFASGYSGDLAQAWDDAGIVVLGTPKLVQEPELGSMSYTAFYTMKIEKAFKGAKTGEEIQFIDPSFTSSAELRIKRGSKNLIFIQTLEDRQKYPSSRKENIQGLSGLIAFRVDEENSPKIETALAVIQEYKGLMPENKKAFLLKHLSDDNRYSESFIIGETLRARITEAAPCFREKLSKSTNEEEKIGLLGDLRFLGDSGGETQLLSWLSDDSFKKKREIINAMERWNDRVFIPAFRTYVYNQDELLEVSARIGLFKLGEPDGKDLLFEVIWKGTDPIARYNAIYTLNWEYKGAFTGSEREQIRLLVSDRDSSIALVAKLIVDKWK